MAPPLELRECTKRFGGLTAVDRLSLVVDEGEILGLIGPNGAGKTTVFNFVTGLDRVTSGEVIFRGRPTTRQRPHQVARAGIARTFQNIRLFGEVSALDNVRTAFQASAGYGLAASLLRTRRVAERETEIERRSFELLRRFDLAEKAHEVAKNLPYGDQRRLEIVRAMATGPKLLLLDEPAAGLNAAETQQLMALVRSLRDEFHLTIFLIEHDMRMVMGICERIAVLDYGVLIAEGTPEQVQNDPRVISAYLGEVTP